MIRLICFLIILMSPAVFTASGQPLSIDRVDPPFWWVGMADNKLELLIKGDSISSSRVMVRYSGVKVNKVHTVENPDYYFLQLVIDSTAMPGKIPLMFRNRTHSVRYEYELKKRKKPGQVQQGISSEDLIYLIMPDRFSNGDPNNDMIDAMNEKELNRDSMFYRHGGDLQGIIDHLDYVKDLGATALWLNPVLENDEPLESYHGYAITDHYKVDPRFGSNELYLEFVSKCHEQGLKVIMDVVYNHVGDRHYWIEDLPDPSWLHLSDTFTRTSYRAPTLMDPYAAEIDKNIMSKGWFDHHMPDINQQDPWLAAYLVRNSIWWIEYSGIDGFRIDTYAYADQQFMADLNAAILKEYPDFGIFGETWVHGVPIQSFFTESKPGEPGSDSKLPGVTDFQLYYAINDALTQPFGWTEGVARLYYTLAKDYVYKDPFQNVIFLDNHDLSRFYSMVKEDPDRFKMGIAFLLTTRGIPMIYYGTEILMKNFADPDGKVRNDFPGGWPTDPVNKFEAAGRTEQEQEAFEYIRQLARYRQNNLVLQTGRLMQFVPEKGVYVYFRYNDQQTVMVVMNSQEKAMTIRTDRFRERIQGAKTAENIITGESLDIGKKITIPPLSVLLLEF